MIFVTIVGYSSSSSIEAIIVDDLKVRITKRNRETACDDGDRPVPMSEQDEDWRAKWMAGDGAEGPRERPREDDPRPSSSISNDDAIYSGISSKRELTQRDCCAYGTW